jgi:hypothetical protein
VHLVGFTIGIYYGARTHEGQTNLYSRRHEIAKAGKMKAVKAGPRHTLKSERNLNKTVSINLFLQS